jgi:hypothetical protein
LHKNNSYQLAKYHELPYNRTMMKTEIEMRVWIVVGEDRGMGPTIGGVFSSLAAAQAWIEDLGSSHYYIYDEDGEVVYN